MGFDAKKNCEEGNVDGQNGIFYNDTCHYYNVLKRLCVKVAFDNESSYQPIYYDSGCYVEDQATLFKNAEPGQYYDFSSAVSMEVRSSQDPYMVFTYARENLGTDFSLFLYLSIFTFTVAVISSLMICYYYCFSLEKLNPMDRATNASART